MSVRHYKGLVLLVLKAHFCVQHAAVDSLLCHGVWESTCCWQGEVSEGSNGSDS